MFLLSCGQSGSLKPKRLLGAVASVSQADSLTGEELHDAWVLVPMRREAVSKRSHLVPLWCVRGSVNGTFNSSKCVKNRGMGGSEAYSIRHSRARASQGHSCRLRTCFCLLLSVLFALGPGCCTWGLAQARLQLHPQPPFHFLFRQVSHKVARLALNSIALEGLKCQGSRLLSICA